VTKKKNKSAVDKTIEKNLDNLGLNDEDYFKE
jgi:hypothetical protein